MDTHKCIHAYVSQKRSWFARTTVRQLAIHQPWLIPSWITNTVLLLSCASHTHTHTHAHTYIYIYIYMHMHTHPYIYIYSLFLSFFLSFCICLSFCLSVYLSIYLFSFPTFLFVFLSFCISCDSFLLSLTLPLLSLPHSALCKMSL